MEFTLIEERLSVIQLRRSFHPLRKNWSPNTQLHVWLAILGIYWKSRVIARKTKQSERSTIRSVTRLRRVSDQARAMNEWAGLVADMHANADNTADILNGLVEVISDTRKVRNRLRYLKLRGLALSAQLVLNRLIAAHDAAVRQRLLVVELLADIDPPKETYGSVQELIQSMSRAV